MHYGKIITSLHGEVGSESATLGLANGRAVMITICDDEWRCDHCSPTGANSTHVALYDPAQGGMACADIAASGALNVEVLG